MRSAGEETAERPARDRRAAREVPRFRLPLPRVDRRPGHVGIVPAERLGLDHGNAKRVVPPHVSEGRGPVRGRDPRRVAGVRGAVQCQRDGLCGRGGRRRRSRSRPGSCSGSTATASSRSTGFRARTAPDYEMTPCLQPLARFRNDIHVLSGVDNPAARLPGPGNGHHNSMSGLVSGRDVHRPRRRRPFHRPGDRPARSATRAASARCRSASARSRSARASSAT